MDIRQLEHLVALVELGTVHAAAKDRFISQPGLSGSIKRLESQLGIFDHNELGAHHELQNQLFLL